MGIQNLLPFVRKACEPASLEDFRGCVVAVDALCWLHKGSIACAKQLATGEPTTVYVQFCLRYVRLLRSFGLHVVLVFDGAPLPAKKLTDKSRRERREVMKERGHKSLEEGNASVAFDHFKQSISITSEMVADVIKACEAIPLVDCLVSPYESDAQLAYLSHAGLVQLVITEDSDLIPFGCEKIFFKLDNLGKGLLYDRSNLPVCLGLNADKFSFAKFRRACILSGCDYLANLPGIGLQKAMKFFTKVTNPDIRRMLPKLPKYLNMTSLLVPEDYVDSFIQAEQTFLYQLAYDPVNREMRPVNPYPEELTGNDMPFCGNLLPARLAYQIAIGAVDPRTHARTSGIDPKKNDIAVTRNHRTIWNPNFLMSQADSQSTSKSPCKVKFQIEAPRRPNRNRCPFNSGSTQKIVSRDVAKTSIESELANLLRGDSKIPNDNTDSIASQYETSAEDVTSPFFAKSIGFRNDDQERTCPLYTPEPNPDRVAEKATPQSSTTLVDSKKSHHFNPFAKSRFKAENTVLNYLAPKSATIHKDDYLDDYATAADENPEPGVAGKGAIKDGLDHSGVGSSTGGGCNDFRSPVSSLLSGIGMDHSSLVSPEGNSFENQPINKSCVLASLEAGTNHSGAVVGFRNHKLRLTPTIISPSKRTPRNGTISGERITLATPSSSSIFSKTPTSSLNLECFRRKRVKPSNVLFSNAKRKRESPEPDGSCLSQRSGSLCNRAVEDEGVDHDIAGAKLIEQNDVVHFSIEDTPCDSNIVECERGVMSESECTNMTNKSESVQPCSSRDEYHSTNRPLTIVNDVARSIDNAAPASMEFEPTTVVPSDAIIDESACSFSRNSSEENLLNHVPVDLIGAGGKSRRGLSRDIVIVNQYGANEPFNKNPIEDVDEHYDEIDRDDDCHLTGEDRSGVGSKGGRRHANVTVKRNPSNRCRVPGLSKRGPKEKKPIGSQTKISDIFLPYVFVKKTLTI